MIYEFVGILAFVFVGLVLYASLWMDIRQSHRRYRRVQNLSTAA